jgi:hypothetical protein
MKSVLVILAITIAATAACNSSTSTTCVTARCGGNSGTYQACDQENGTVQYNFSSTSCSCTPSNPLGCQTCKNTLATYCGVVIGGGSSSSSSGSSSGSSSSGGDASTGDSGDDGGGGDTGSGESSTDGGAGDSGGDTGSATDSGGG